MTENKLGQNNKDINRPEQSIANPGFILEYIDQKGIISKISSILAENDINIASMTVTRSENIATMTCQVEGNLGSEVKKQLKESCEFTRMNFINTEDD